MSRDHLRLVGQKGRPPLRIVARQESPLPVNRIDTFTFAHVDGALVVLHNDDRLSAAEAFAALTTLLREQLLPAIAISLGGRHVLPGDAGGIEFYDCHPCPASTAARPVCAETEGDMS